MNSRNENPRKPNPSDSDDKPISIPNPVPKSPGYDDNNGSNPRENEKDPEKL